MNISIQRVYDTSTKNEGERWLVDRLWPRGISKTDLQLDGWLRELTPSDELRKWAHADKSARHEEFVRKYRLELEANKELAQKLLKGKKSLVLLTAVKDIEHSHVPLLADFLQRLSNFPKPLYPIQCHLWTNEVVTENDLSALAVCKVLTDESHFIVSIKACQVCGQLYLYVFYEEIDWEKGEDPQYRSLFPVQTIEEGEMLSQKHYLELLSYSPRLEWNFTDIKTAPTWIGRP